jgi:phosphatidylserine/phosphatidylglycerophosphate/cardiolipin synthase-like enzyme
MAVDLGHIKFYTGPRDVDPAGAASTLDDLEQVIVDYLDGAVGFLDIAVQEVDSMPIAEAIVRAQLRGVRVRLVSEADYLIDEKPAPLPFVPDNKLANETNRLIQMALLRAKAWVRTDFNPKIFHQKFIIRDKKGILTGSTNFTLTDTHKNLNHIVIIEDETVAKEFAREFTDISNGHFGKYSVAPTRKPKELMINNVRVKVCFAPDHGPEMEIMKQMMKARDRIDFAIFTFAGSSGIDDTMLTIHDRVKLRGILDHTQGTRTWAPTKALAAAGIELYLAGGDKKGIRKLHHKLMTIDDSLTIIGSFNYTGPANLLNDENIVVLGDIHHPTAEQKAIALAARLEIDRIVKDHGSPVKVPGMPSG